MSDPLDKRLKVQVFGPLYTVQQYAQAWGIKPSIVASYGDHSPAGYSAVRRYVRNDYGLPHQAIGKELAARCDAAAQNAKKHKYKLETVVERE